MCMMEKKFLAEKELKKELRRRYVGNVDCYSHDTLKSECSESVKFRDSFNNFLDAYAEAREFGFKKGDLQARIEEVEEEGGKKDIDTEILKEKNEISKLCSEIEQKKTEYSMSLNNSLGKYNDELDKRMNKLINSFKKNKDAKIFDYFKPEFISNLLTDVCCLSCFVDKGGNNENKAFEDETFKYFCPKFLSEGGENLAEQDASMKVFKKNLKKFYDKSLAILKALGYKDKDILPNVEYKEDYERVKQLFIDAVRRGSLRQMSRADINILVNGIAGNENELKNIAKCVGGSTLSKVLKFDKKKDKFLGSYPLKSGQLFDFLKALAKDVGANEEFVNEEFTENLIKNEQNEILQDKYLRVKKENIASKKYEKNGEEFFLKDKEYYDVHKDYDIKLNTCISDVISGQIINKEENDNKALLSRFCNKEEENECKLECFEGNEGQEYIDVPKLYSFLLKEKNIDVKLLMKAMKQISSYLNTDEQEPTKEQKFFSNKFRGNRYLISEYKLCGLLIMCFANPYSHNYMLTPEEKNFVIGVVQSLMSGNNREHFNDVLEHNADESYFGQLKRKELSEFIDQKYLKQFCFKKSSDTNNYNENIFKTNLAAIDYIWYRVFKKPEIADETYSTKTVVGKIVKDLTRDERNSININKKELRELKQYYNEKGDSENDLSSEDSFADYSDYDDLSEKEGTSLPSKGTTDFSNDSDGEYSDDEISSEEINEQSEENETSIEENEASIEDNEQESSVASSYEEEEEKKKHKNKNKNKDKKKSEDKKKNETKKNDAENSEKLLNAYAEAIRIKQENEKNLAYSEVLKCKAELLLMKKYQYYHKNDDDLEYEIRDKQEEIKEATKKYNEVCENELSERKINKLISGFEKNDIKKKMFLLETEIDSQRTVQNNQKKQLKKIADNLLEVLRSVKKKQYKKNNKRKMYQKSYKKVHQSKPDLDYSSDSGLYL